jgi:hypothetical protein
MHVSDARRATLAISGGVRPAVNTRKIGTAANGSTIAKTDPKHSTAYVNSSRTPALIAATTTYFHADRVDIENHLAFADIYAFLKTQTN